MVFTSLEYALLLGVTLAAYWLLPGRTAPWVLIAASIVFYARWSVPYLALVGGSIALGYVCGRGAELARDADSRRRLPVASAVVVLLGLLAYFKYADFLLAAAGPWIGSHEPLGVVLPLAISFYTFQILGYVIDVSRGEAAERSFPRFALFVGFFPQLIAGPIVRARQLLPQLVARAPFDPDRTLNGLLLLSYGLVKKTVFADNLAVFVDRVFGEATQAGGIDVVLASIAFGAQIYCDFSGYTDIARGSARMLGIELPVNFRSPYAARSVGDFWRRWHITLSTWLRDYLYVPLGGNRRGGGRLLANLMVTMLLGGLWHGASFSFVLWGAYHGALLAIERWLGVGRGEERGGWLGLTVTFALVQVGWCVFRAGDLATLRTLGERLVQDPLATNPWFGSLEFLPLILSSYGLHALSAWVRQRPGIFARLSSPWLAAPALATSVLLVIVFGGSSEAFIYFQF